jgi:hypothetical protein
MGPGPGPGQPGPYAYQPPYPSPPPGGPRVLGTLSIVFGSIVAAFSLFGAVGGGAGMAGMMNPGNVGHSVMQDYLQAIRTPSLIQSLMYVVMSVWLVCLGVGQRRYRAWAARQSVLWGVVALACLVGAVGLYLGVIGPAAERMADEVARSSGLPRGFGSVMRWAGISGIVFYVPYPIILIVTFRKPRVVSAMTT